MGSMIWLVIMAFCRHTRQQIRADQVKPSILVRSFVVTDLARERTYRTRSVRAFCDRKPGAHVPATPNATVPWSLIFVPVQRRHRIRSPFGFFSWCRAISACIHCTQSVVVVLDQCLEFPSLSYGLMWAYVSPAPYHLHRCASISTHRMGQAKVPCNCQDGNCNAFLPWFD
jgi:hypothetical protein